MRKYRTQIVLSTVTLEEAKVLQQLLDEHASPDCFPWMRSELKEGLKPFYVYEVKCSECGRTYNTESSKPIKKEFLEKGGVCNNCMDDFK